MTAIPSDTYIRLMLDGASPAAFDPLFFKAIEDRGLLTPFQRLGGRTLIALDGTEHFCSRKIHCERCSTRRRSDGGTEYFHAFLGASIVAPGHKRSCRCRRNSSRRRTGRRSRTVSATPRNAGWPGTGRRGAPPAGLPGRRSLRLSADRRGHPSGAGGNFILTCKPSSHQTVSEYLHGANWKSIVRPSANAASGPRRFTAGSPRCHCAPPMSDPVNWVSIEIHNAKGKRTYYNSFVTDLAVNAGNVAELAACGRARWKIENETFNVLKTNGYNLEHNFGHGKKTPTGPTGNRYGDKAGHTCLAVTGAGFSKSLTLETGSADRITNMRAFGVRALELLAEALG